MNQFNGCGRLVKDFMIVNPVPGILGNVTHKQINTFPIGPGAVQVCFKGVATLMGNMGHIQPLRVYFLSGGVCGSLLLRSERELTLNGN